MSGGVEGSAREVGVDACDGVVLGEVHHRPHALAEPETGDPVLQVKPEGRAGERRDEDGQAAEAEEAELEGHRRVPFEVMAETSPARWFQDSSARVSSPRPSSVRR